MCLDKVLRKPKRLPRRGYKNFELRRGRLYSLFRHRARRSYPVGEWIVDKGKKKLTGLDGKTYKSGFHIFLEEGVWSTIYHGHSQRRVAFRRVVVYGKDYGIKTVVAREMKILPEEK